MVDHSDSIQNQPSVKGRRNRAPKPATDVGRCRKDHMRLLDQGRLRGRGRASHCDAANWVQAAALPQSQDVVTETEFKRLEILFLMPVLPSND